MNKIFMLKAGGFALFLGGMVSSGLWPLPALVFMLLLLVSGSMWIAAFFLENIFLGEDLPFLCLCLGTVVFGRAFSIIGITVRGIPLYVTEAVIGLSILYWIRRPGKTFALWKDRLRWHTMALFGIYILWGTLYLAAGLFTNGIFALRDIVFFHYSLLFFMVIHLFYEEKTSAGFSRFMVLGMAALVVLGCLIYLIPGTAAPPLYRFLKETKQFNWAWLFGLTAIAGLCFFSTARRRKWIVGIGIYLSLLFIVMTLVRAAWIGILVALIFLGAILKKEMLVLAVIIPCIIGSVFLLDILPFRVEIAPKIMEEVEGMLPGDAPTNPRLNLEWRKSIWTQTLQKILEKPFFGWGFGRFIQYTIRGNVLPPPQGVGTDSGIIPPHNHLLAFAYKTGIPGLALFLFLNIRIFWIGFRHLKNCRSPVLRKMLIFSLAGLVYWHVIAFFFDMLESPPTAIYLWIMLGMVVGTVDADRRNRSQSDSHGI